MIENKNLKLYMPDAANSMELPLSEGGVSAGFPSPAEEFLDLTLDLNRELIKNPAATFYARVSGDSMIDDGINDGDLLVIDRSVEPYNNCLAVCYIDGEFTLKRFQDKGSYGLLVPANKNYKPIRVTEDNEFTIWGVVRYVIKRV